MLFVIEFNAELIVILTNRFIYTFYHAEMVAALAVILKAVMQNIFNKVNFQHTRLARLKVKNRKKQEWIEMTIFQHVCYVEVL